MQSSTLPTMSCSLFALIRPSVFHLDKVRSVWGNICADVCGKHSLWITGSTILALTANIISSEDRIKHCSSTNVLSYFQKAERYIYLSPEHHSSLYLLITSDALISVFSLFCGLLLRSALHQNIMNLASHSAVLTDHSQWAEHSRWPYKSWEHREGFLRPRQSFVWRQMRTH